MVHWLDFKIFGNGHGLGAPFFNQPFYWLNGRFYTFTHGFGAQLSSIEWRTPKVGERRDICGVEFRPFNYRRKWGRVYCSWTATHAMPKDIDGANAWMRQFLAHLQYPNGQFQYRPPKDPTP